MLNLFFQVLSLDHVPDGHVQMCAFANHFRNLLRYNLFECRLQPFVVFFAQNLSVGLRPCQVLALSCPGGLTLGVLASIGEVVEERLHEI